MEFFLMFVDPLAFTFQLSSLHYAMWRWPVLTYPVSCFAGLGGDATILSSASRPHRQTEQTLKRPWGGLPTIRRHSERRYTA